jgi:hypothetical protein
MTLTLPAAPNMEHLKTQAKRLLEAFSSQDPDAIRRVASHYPHGSAPDATREAARLKLSGAQLVVAREYGFASWQKLKRHVESLSGGSDETAPTRKFRQIVAELHLADVAAAAAFFEEDLGFKRSYTLAYPDGSLDFAVLINDPVEIFLHNFSSDIRAELPKHVRFYFRAVDARGLHQELLSRGRLVSDVVATDYGSLEFSLIGPEGYALVFQQFV